MTEGRFYKGNLVKIEHIVFDWKVDEDTRWVSSLGIVLTVKPILQIAHVYIPEYQKHKYRVPYKYLSHLKRLKS